MIGSRFRSTNTVVKNLIILNALMLLVSYVMEARFGIELADILGLHYFRSPKFEPYQFVTHLFMHGDFFHLLFNMFALWMFGNILEQVWGSKRFLMYYFITGLGAALIHTFVNYLDFSSILNDATAFYNSPGPETFRLFVKENVLKVNPAIYDFLTDWENSPNDLKFRNEAIGFVQSFVNNKIDIPTVGASGAVYGVLLAFGMLFPNTELMLLFPPIPIKAKWMVMIYAGLELYLGLTQPGSTIAHFAHLGGMIFGFILIKIWNQKKIDYY